MNTISSTHQMAALGIQRGIEKIERGAASTASAESFKGAQPNLADSLVGMKEGKLQAQASAKAIQAADDMIGLLVDVTA